MSVLPQSFGEDFSLPLAETQRAETEQLEQWWKRLSAQAQAAFAGAPEGPIPSEHLDDVLAAGIRVMGVQRGGTSMVWRFAPRVQAFIAAAGERSVSDIHSLGAS